MKEKTNLIQANIHNLVSFWQKAATPFNGSFESDDFSYCYLKNSDWPNRLWFGDKFTQNNINAAKIQLGAILKNLTVPYWDLYNRAGDQLLEGGGFKEKSVQIGMSLQLKKQYNPPLRLQLERVEDAHRAKSWAQVYPSAFGYRISEDIPAKLHPNIEFYLASHQGVPVGTAMLYQTGDVVGVHGVGIIPPMRRQGFAEEIMEFVLNRAMSLDASYVTLQASALGKGLYDKLGFTEDFTIKNYQLDQDN